jgi:hypothetical protein
MKDQSQRLYDLAYQIARQSTTDDTKATVAAIAAAIGMGARLADLRLPNGVTAVTYAGGPRESSVAALLDADGTILWASTGALFAVSEAIDAVREQGKTNQGKEAK